MRRFGESWEDALEDIDWTDGDVLVVGSSSIGQLARVFLGSRSSKIVATRFVLEARSLGRAAAELAEEVLAENGEHRDANLVLGTMLLGKGKLDEAIRSGRSALRQEPTWLPALRLVAEAHLGKGETTLALDALRQIVDLDPNDARYAGLLAQLLTERGDDAAALKLWDRVAGLGDDPSPALRARAEIEMRRRNFPAAQADIDRLLGTPGQEETGSLLAGELGWDAEETARQVAAYVDAVTAERDAPRLPPIAAGEPAPVA